MTGSLVLLLATPVVVLALGWAGVWVHQRVSRDETDVRRRHAAQS